MRFAAISDIHGNSFALSAVFDDIDSQNVDFTLNLGDSFSGPFLPHETARLLESRPMRTVRGNHDRQLTAGPRDELALSDRHAFDALKEPDLSWARDLPDRIDLDGRVLAVHGSPRRDDEFLLTSLGPSGARPATPAEVRERLGDALHYELIVCGHSHIARHLALDDGPLVVDVGGVGWQAWGGDERVTFVIESGSPHARYAVFDDSSGSWEFEPRYVVYDWESAAKVAERNGRPPAAFAARTGRVSGLDYLLR